MASVADTRGGPRYGSAAELAAYAGVSVKTVRRLVDAGQVRGLKLGRRLLIPFEDLDAHILKIGDHRPGRPTMQATPTAKTPEPPTSHRLRVDGQGRLLPLVEAERRDRSKALGMALDAMAAIPDDPPGSDEEFWRAVDAGRPERPVFRGLY